MNCTFYEPGKANACKEPQADYVKEKDRRNYCEYFNLSDVSDKKSGKEEAEKLWQQLFKNDDQFLPATHKRELMCLPCKYDLIFFSVHIKTGSAAT